ncbi:MAG: ankyrin repeat domain-containing protein, partial [Verrucomicrobiota bacterium]
FTGRHGENADYRHPQPALWTRGTIHSQRGKQQFPVLFGDSKTMKVNGRYLREGAHVLVDGRRVDAKITSGENERIDIVLNQLPSPGMHFLQVQNPSGLFSNDFIFHVVANPSDSLTQLQMSSRHRVPLSEAISKGDSKEATRLIRDGAALNGHHPDTGLTPLSGAAFYGEAEVMAALLDFGANASLTSRDGNSPLHTAAFLCRSDMVKTLLEHGAATDTQNDRGETPIDVVTGEWSEELAGFYRHLDQIGDLNLDLAYIKDARKMMSKLLSEHRDAKDRQ